MEGGHRIISVQMWLSNKTKTLTVSNTADKFQDCMAIPVLCNINLFCLVNVKTYAVTAE